ncbi:glycosyltransferase [Myxococcota bacterium]|nr:glycosyltransferase [Myxococcota bacterium]
MAPPPLSLLHLDTAMEHRGGQRQLLLLSLGLAARGHAQAVCCPPESPLWAELLSCGAAPIRLGEPLIPGVVQLLPTPKNNHPLGVSSCWRLRRAYPDAVPIAHTPHAHGLWAAAGARPVVHRRVDFVPHADPFTRLKWSRVSRCVCVSEAVGKVMTRWGLPAERVTVVADGVRPLPAAPPAALGDGPVVLAVGALVAHKDHETFIQAAQGLDAQAVIAGDGPLRAQLEGRGVRLLGQRPDVAALLARATVFVHCSCEEGMGQAVVEAMLAGVPVVATTAGGVPEVVGAYGLLVPPGDPAALRGAVQRALAGDHPDVEAARTWAAARFSVEAMVEGTEAAYREARGGGLD